MQQWELLERAYEQQQNYRIIDNPLALEPDLAVIYFSSIGTYSSANCVQRLRDDYYEFHRNPVSRAGRHIYVRDVALAFYSLGINKEINSIEKLLDLLQTLTQKYRVITVGISSGGFMAMLSGAVLKAEYVISISGQIDIREEIKNYISARPEWVSSKLPSQCPYYDNQKLLAQSATPVFQFEAAQCIEDLPNAKLLSRISNVRIFNIESERHGRALNPYCIGHLLNLSLPVLEELHRRFSTALISQWSINRTLLGVKELSRIYSTKFYKKIFKFKFTPKTRRLIIFGITIFDYKSDTKNV